MTDISCLLLADGFTASLWKTLLAIVVLLLPFVAFAVIIHWFERVTQTRLAERFGWRSVMWTGWLGTPIHELSHVVMCWLFRHRVDDMALFEPDRESGRLGYVKHSYRRGSLFEEIGNLFIGIAPLIGGTLVLLVLLWIFYPNAIEDAIATTTSAETTGNVLLQTWVFASNLASEILTVEHLGSVRFWIFIYFVLCVGSHMAPSGNDYQGATRGALLAGGLLLLCAVLVAAAGWDPSRFADSFVSAAGPLYAILGLTVVLCFLATVIVYLLTALIPKFGASGTVGR